MEESTVIIGSTVKATFNTPELLWGLSGEEAGVLYESWVYQPP